MEIRIKTTENFHDSGVTIEIRADDAVEAGEVGKRLTGWSPDVHQEIEQLQAELKRATAGHVCVERCDPPNRHVAFIGRQRLIEAEAQLAGAQEAREIETRRADRLEAERDREAVRAREFDLDRKTERDRADRLSAELQIAKGVLDKAVASARADERALWEDRLATEQRLCREDAARWARVQELLYSTAVKQAIRTEHSPGAIALGNAIRDVRRILDEPEGNNSTT